MYPYGGVLETVLDKGYERHQAELAAPHSQPVRQALVQAALCCLTRLADALEEQQAAREPGDSSSTGGSGSSSAAPYSSDSSSTAMHTGGRPDLAVGRGSGSCGSGSGNGSGSDAGGSNGDAVLHARTWSAVMMLGPALQTPVMLQAFGEAALAPGSLLSGLKAAVRLAKALPLATTLGLPPDMLAYTHATAVDCVEAMASCLLRHPHILAVWDLRAGNQAEAAGSEEEEEGEEAARAAAQAETADADAEAVEAAWQALALLPHLAEVLPLLVCNPDSRVQSVVDRCALPMQLPHLLGEFQTADQVMQWAAAAAAALRLLPLLVSRDAQAAQQGSLAQGQQQAAGGEEAAGGSEGAADGSGPATGAEELAHQLVCHVWDGGTDRLASWMVQFSEGGQPSDEAGSEGEQQGSHCGQHTAPPPQQLVKQLFSLHTAACRSFACLGEQATPAPEWLLQQWPDLASSCTAVLGALYDLLSSSEDLVRCGASRA